jgi:Fic family protein
MGELEKFLHSDTPALVKAALAHLQFETIHPFLDGNGRIGRLLISLLLCHEGVLREPLLYSSLYFKQNRQRYYDELNGARESGDFERWLDFFATAIRVSAEQATTTGLRILTQSTGFTTPTVTQALSELQKLGIVRETTGRARGRIFAYVRYLDTLNAETEATTP